MEDFKKGYWWISYPGDEGGVKYYLGFFTSPDDLYDDEKFIVYLGESYENFKELFNLKEV